jgi:hypothetical protein
MSRRTVHSITRGGDGKVLHEEKAERNNPNNNSVITSADGKRILSEDK